MTSIYTSTVKLHKNGGKPIMSMMCPLQCDKPISEKEWCFRKVNSTSTQKTKPKKNSEQITGKKRENPF